MSSQPSVVPNRDRLTRATSCSRRARSNREYFEIGVDSVWIVEPENTAVLVYQSATDFARLGNDDVLKGDGTLAGFALRVGHLFE